MKNEYDFEDDVIETIEEMIERVRDMRKRIEDRRKRNEFFSKIVIGGALITFTSLSLAMILGWI